MNNSLIAILSLSLVAILGGSPDAAQKIAPEKARDLLTAIDVVEFLKNGGTDSEAAQLLSSRYAFDREEAIKGGLTDRQILLGLLNDPPAPKDSKDKNRVIRHRFEADKALKIRQYEKAASEYTSAINSSQGDVALYKSRGESYLNYLTAMMAAPEKNGRDVSREVLCNCIYTDYKKAIRNNNEELQRVESRLIILKADMSNKEMTDLAKGNVAPHHYRAAGNIQGMRELDRLYRLQRAARNNEADLRKDVDDYRLACREEDAVLRNSLMMEKERNREKKWKPYEKIGTSSFFYDTSSVERSGDRLNIRTLSENMDDSLSDRISLVRVNCKEKTAATIESSTYDEFGILIKKEDFNLSPDKVAHVTAAETLANEVCR